MWSIIYSKVSIKKLQHFELGVGDMTFGQSREQKIWLFCIFGVKYVVFNMDGKLLELESSAIQLN